MVLVYMSDSTDSGKHLCSVQIPEKKSHHQLLSILFNEKENSDVKMIILSKIENHVAILVQQLLRLDFFSVSTRSLFFFHWYLAAVSFFGITTV